jgi:hypothetical protein
VATTAPEAEAAGTSEDSQTAAAATEKPVEGAAEAEMAAPAAEPVATTAPEASAAGTSEDSQTAAAATEAPTEG